MKIAFWTAVLLFTVALLVKLGERAMYGGIS